MKKSNNHNGRPPKADRKILCCFRLHPDTVQRLKARAAERHTSQAAVIEDLIARPSE